MDLTPLTQAEVNSNACTLSAELPWSRAEVAYATARAMRAAEGHPRQRQLVAQFLLHLAERGEPGRDRQVRELRAWLKKQPLPRLRDLIEQADITAIAERSVAGTHRKRGDLVQAPRRARETWWNCRQK
jgi:hypothetical protein